MTAVTLPGQGIAFPAWNAWGITNASAVAWNGYNAVTIDATNERIHMVGHLWLESGPGTTKTFGGGSSAIGFMNGAVTFATSGSQLTLGVQDVATGLSSGTGSRGDGTFDVSRTITQGTDTVSANSWNNYTTFSGTKDLSHGDLVAVVCEFTTRNGADTVAFNIFPCDIQNKAHPCATLETSGPAFSRQTGLPCVRIIFSDGTRGTLFGAYPFSSLTTESYNNGSTPDERGLLFSFDAAVSVAGAWVGVNVPNSSFAADFDVVLYGDPLGTPTALATATFDLSTIVLSAGSSIFDVVWVPFTSHVALTAGNDYALVVKPTTANNVTIGVMSLDASDDRTCLPGGMNASYCAATNGGAFSETSTKIPQMGVMISKIDDGAGGGGGSGGARIIGGTVVR